MSAPFDRLSADLVPQIFQFVHERDHYKLTLVCKSLHAEATKLLYSDLDLLLRFDSNVALFVRTIIDHPNLAEHVKVLDARGEAVSENLARQRKMEVRQILSPKQLRTLKGHLINIINLERGLMDSYHIVDLMFAFIVSKAVNLNALTLSGYFQDLCTPKIVRRLIEFPIGKTLAFQKIQKLQVYVPFDGKRVDFPMLEVMNTLFSLPSLSYLGLGGTHEGWESYFGHLHSRTSSSLTELVLGTHILQETVCQILQFMPNLKRLSHKDFGRWRLYGETLQLDQALLQFRKTLESFELIAENYTLYDGIVSSVGSSLSSMKKLTHVELPLHIAFGLHELFTTTLEHTLPASLRSLTLGCGLLPHLDRNTTPSFQKRYHIDEILRFFERKTASAPLLERFTLTFWHSLEPPSIPDQPTFDLLYTTARDQGVAFQVEVATWDRNRRAWDKIIPNDMPYFILKSREDEW
ncbi:hypothetical protein BU16DRAFT_542602 [Lophium mytilinum]|uniref:F-box domain-containing protein n=1 Tax=Lophium mytilinum TaxID=390894 RepID=A0A6A6QJ58_9PEZI|nr:hypothetical protein BU16DRAFT_542602 [Lophium mytilinum]